jgi:regulator of sigma D
LGLVTHTVLFPKLVEVTQRLLLYLQRDEDTDLRTFSYPRLINHLGGIRQAAEALVSFIDPEIIELQDNIITASR